jgi:hypothetical protein
VRTFAEDLDSMHAEDQSAGLASQVVQEVAQQAQALASRLEGREPRELLDDVRRFARRRPGTFILGALVAGVIAGRLTRAGKAAQDSGTSGSPVTPVPPTDDAGSQAYLSDETGADDIEIFGTPAAGPRPGTTAGPGAGRS